MVNSTLLIFRHSARFWPITSCLIAVLVAAPQVYAQTASRSFTYNDLGLLEAEDGPRMDVEDVTRFQYDSSGNRTAVVDPLGHATAYTSHDASGRVLAAQDANGVITEFEYHPRGWLLKSTVLPPVGSGLSQLVTEYEYYADGELKRLVTPGQEALNFEYNDANHLTAIANDAGERIEYEPDLAGNQTKQTILSATGAITYELAQVFDELSRVMAVVGNHGQEDGIRYDANDNPILWDNAKNAATQKAYDALNRLTQVIDPLAGETTYTYDSSDRITSVTDPNSNTTTYTYDAFGNLTELHSPDTGTTTYVYDPAGNRTRMVDARGVAVEYTYDALNRLLTETYPSTPSENVTYTYDDSSNGNFGIGRLTGISRADVTLAFVYNHLGQVTERRQAINAAGSTSSVTATTRYTYNSLGQLTALTYPSGREVRYSYDGQGRASGIDTRANSTANWQAVISDAGYLPFGPANHYSYGNGLTHSLTFDLDYRLTEIEVGGINPLLSRSYFFDVTDNITGIDNLLATGKSQSFDYDLLDRLIEAQGGYGVLAYTYDGVGNRMSETRDGLTDAYDYAVDSNRLLGLDAASGSDLSYTYDAAGNRIAKTEGATTAQSYTYNAANRLSSITGANGTTTFRYNPLGQRIAKTSPSGATEHYHYDEAGHLLAVTDQAGITLREYLYWGDQQIALHIETAAAAGIAPNIPLAAEAASFTGSHYLTTAQPGYSGTAFVDYVGEGAVHWQVEVPAAGAYRLSVRYALMSGSRPLNVQLNGEIIGQLSIPSSGSWTVWIDDTLDLTLPAGIHTLTLATTGASGPNLDQAELASLTSTPPTAGTGRTGLFYLHNDHLGTAQVITDQNQQVVWAADYEPFGQAAIQEDGIAHFSRFPGQYQDPETGLHYNYFRDYDAGIGRYLQSDPIGLSGGINTYAYVSANPLRYADPSGLLQVCQTGISLTGGQRIGPAKHTYHCWTGLDGAENCKGFSFDPSYSPSYVDKAFGPIPGEVMQDRESNESGAAPGETTCTEDDNNTCMDRCVEAAWNLRSHLPPAYGLAFGHTCNSLADEIYQNCTQQCK